MAELPDQVERFIADHIENLEQLEILLLLRAEQGRAFAPEEVTRELRLGRDSAKPWLETMATRKLAFAEGSPARFRFNASHQEASAIDQLARCYAERKVTVITQIFSPRSAARSFADAFKLRGK